MPDGFYVLKRKKNNMIKMCKMRVEKYGKMCKNLLKKFFITV